MACTKHPIRKRKDCPECYPGLKQDEVINKTITEIPIKEHIDKTIINEKRAKKVIEDIKSKDNKVLITSTPTGDNPFYEEFKKATKKEKPEIKLIFDESTPFMKEQYDYINEWQKVMSEAIAFKKEIESIDKYFNDKKEEFNKYIEDGLKKYQKEIDKLSKLKYERQVIPVSKMSTALLDKMAEWSLKCLLTGDCAKISGFKEDVFIMERVNNEIKK